MTTDDRLHRTLMAGALVAGGMILAGDGASAQTSASVTLLADGADLLSNVVTGGAGHDQLFVLEQHTGQVRQIVDGGLHPEPFLDLGARLVDTPNFEEGLLGLAFPPGFPEARHVYASYVDVEGHIVLSRFQVTPDLDAALVESEEVLLAEPGDAAQHYCGHIVFNPHDGYLYVCIGDGQPNVDPAPVSQDLTSLRGKMLRLDVEGGGPGYAIPPDNPFAEEPEAYPEIWLYGLRNPWHFTVDQMSGDLMIPDVGRRAWEEVSVYPARGAAGRNFGWPLAEGNDCFSDCDDEELVWPVYEYPSIDDRCSIIGGEIYYGDRHPAWHGIYVFGDHCSGEVWGLRQTEGGWSLRRLLASSFDIAAIGAAPDGELLVLDRSEGAVYQLTLPPDFDAGWVAAAEVHYRDLLTVRRAGAGWTEERLQSILDSRRWAWADRFGRAYRWIRSPFGRAD